MAVKQKVLEHVGPAGEARVQIILRFLQEIPQQNGLQDKMCAQIVTGLGSLQIPSEPEKYIQFVNDIKSIQDILTKECRSSKLIFVALESLYKDICDNSKYHSPAMSIVLQLITPDYIPGAVKWILQSGFSEQNLKNALLTLCSWLAKWTWTENLGPLILTLLQGLESDHHFDILIDVTIATIEPLFKLIILPEFRKSVGPVVFYMLTKLQHRPDAFHKIIPHVRTVLQCLNNEKTDNSILYIQSIVNLCLALTEHFASDTSSYESLISVLKSYIPTPTLSYKKLLQCQSWSESNFSNISGVGKVGLNNLGNTCYFNCIVQALYMTSFFRKEILLTTNDLTLIQRLQELFALLQYSQRSSLSPNEVLDMAKPPGFIQGHQHDSSEFLGYLLDTLHEQEYNTFAKTSSQTDCSDTIVQKVFGGKTITIFTCGHCDTRSERTDNFRELQLSFPSNSEYQSIQTLLEYYFQPEILYGDNQYQCDVCQCLTDGHRATIISEAPQRLILTLKYFHYDPTSQQRTKLLTNVKLDDNITVEGIKFLLYAVVVHSGSNVDSGHYYTFAKDNQHWYKFNDYFVSKASSEELLRLKTPATPYILFYRRQDSLDPLVLDKSHLSQRLKNFLTKNSVSNRNQLHHTSRYPKFDQNDGEDPPPPPSCGGGNDFSDNNSNMFVC